MFYNLAMNTNIASIGSMAWEVWQHDQIGRVIGVTSRGLFLAIEPRVLFVSFERWRGPLTINLDQSIDQLRAMDVGAEAVFSNARLIFPATELSLSASSAAVWQASLPVSAPGPIDQRIHTLKQIANIVTSRALVRGFAPFLAPLLDLPTSGPLSTEQAAVLSVLRALRQAQRDHDMPAMQDNINRLLGYGNGLTPSGDDCVLGFLLMLNRWQANRDWHHLNQAGIDAAYQKTTNLSANLIECAAQSTADERLLMVADGIATRSASIDECVECVLDWGNSSGIDALTGMALAFS